MRLTNDIKYKRMNIKKLNIEPIKNWGIKKNKRLIISGPCSVESEEQIMQTAIGLSKYNIDILRAGIWKPRTRPNCFEGVGAIGLKWLKNAGEAANMPVTAEAASPEHVEQCLKHEIDMIWIGTRTTVNPFAIQSIADALKGVDIPVLVKNPINPDIELWIGALERLNLAGITKLGAVHRGFSYFPPGEYRNKPNWEIPIELRRRIPKLPLICDPSHMCGKRDLLLYASQIALDLLYDGLMIETHINPEKALSDANQQITPDELGDMLKKLVFKKKRIKNEKFHIELEKLREKIDKIDYTIIDLFAKRMELVTIIGRNKRKNDVSILQPERWKYIVENRIKTAKKRNLSKEFILEIFRKIHDESIRNQLS